MNIDSLPQSSYPSSLPKDQDSTLTGLHQSGSEVGNYLRFNKGQHTISQIKTVFSWDGTTNVFLRN
jgi:hypothetical protein